jgi:hypothetical protein
VRISDFSAYSGGFVTADFSGLELLVPRWVPNPENQELHFIWALPFHLPSMCGYNRSRWSRYHGCLPYCHSSLLRDIRRVPAIRTSRISGIVPKELVIMQCNVIPSKLCNHSKGGNERDVTEDIKRSIRLTQIYRLMLLLMMMITEGME